MKDDEEVRYSMTTSQQLTLEDQGRHCEQSMSDVATISGSFEALANVERRSVQGG